MPGDRETLWESIWCPWEAPGRALTIQCSPAQETEIMAHVSRQQTIDRARSHPKPDAAAAPRAHGIP